MATCLILREEHLSGGTGEGERSRKGQDLKLCCNVSIFVSGYHLVVESRPVEWGERKVEEGGFVGKGKGYSASRKEVLVPEFVSGKKLSHL